VRVRFAEAVRLAWPSRAWVAKPADAPAGYTPNTVLTEWLTLNCAGPWAAQGHGDHIEVRFERVADRERAQSHFAAAHLWRSSPRG
jgi:hypothetical protein